MATVSELIAALAVDRKNVGVYLAAVAKAPLSAHQAASLETDLGTFDKNLAALTAVLAPVAPATSSFPVAAASPSGLTNLTAAETDAGWVFQASLGNLVGAGNNPAPGAAKAFGYSGVSGDSASLQYGVFRNGELVETTRDIPSTGWGFPFGVAEGIDPDAPYIRPVPA